jgi:hypothetical protein
MVLQKVVIVSILELRNTKILDDFAFGSSTRSGRWNRISQQAEENGKVTAVFTGEGATSEGDFHEAYLLLQVWELLVFVIENNGYGLSTPK